MTSSSWYPSEDNAKRITKFILWFSRLEYALKSVSGYATGNKANFDKLKIALKGKAVSSELLTALAYLKNNAPRNQLSPTAWRQINIENDDWGFLIESLKTVRNNLFHGGKHHSGRLLEPVRDAELICFCNLIMKEMVIILPDDVKHRFNQV